MKKIMFALAVMAAGMSAHALDVGVSAVHDYNLSKNGVRLQTAVPVVPGGLTASVTHIEDGYARLAVGKSFDLAKAGPVQFSASVSGVHQTTHNGPNGFGVVVGAGASMPISKNVGLTAGVERFIGQDRVKQFNGNSAVVGLNVKF